MIPKSNSLQFRIVLLSGFWILLALAGTAAVLIHFYNDHIQQHYDAHVQMHMEEMASARLNQDGDLVLPIVPSDPRYHDDFSGWYWEIKHAGEVLAQSPSLQGHTIDLKSTQGIEHRGAQVLEGPDGNPVRVQTLTISAGIPGEQLLLVSSAPMMGIQDDVIDVAQHMVVSLFVLGMGLLVAVLLQIRVALRPINDISRGISDIHQGTADMLSGEFPSDVQPLVNELNNLLEHNSVLLRRARNQLGDLAHTIKNPLTVINNEMRQSDSESAALILKQTADISESVDHHLSRARAFGTTNVLGSRVKIKPIAEDLAFALKRIHKDKNLKFDLACIGHHTVRCEAQDLEELLGNLMDNACKWASRRVFVNCESRDNRSIIRVEDDGPGIPEDKIKQVLQRGHRLDESSEGHGLGLGIVQDLVELYGGKLSLGRSGHGGLCAILDLPGT